MIPTLDKPMRLSLDAMTIDDIRSVYGPGVTATIYQEPIGFWHPGMGEPKLAADTPAVAQAMARCATKRSAKGDYAALLPTGVVHSGECGWCAYPLDVLLAACDHATWMSRHVSAEIVTWPTVNPAVDYTRTTNRSGEYDNPAWATFFQGVTPSTALLPPSDLFHLNERRRLATEAARAIGDS